MAVTLAAFALNKQYHDLQLLTEAILDSALIASGVTSTQGYINTKLTPNIIQLTSDCQGSSYIFTDNGTPAYTANLFDKQNSSKLYNGGDISIGTAADVSYQSVDATNAAITFVPERIGYYRVTCTFTHVFTLNATTEGQCETSFRLSDGTITSQAVRSGGYMPATAANSDRMLTPITISSIFNWTDTSSKTILLQKFVRVATNVSSQSVAATAATGEVYLSVEKI